MLLMNMICCTFLQIIDAFNAARAAGTWDVNSYAMTNYLEYFAEAAGVFFNVNHLYGSSGGMSR